MENVIPIPEISGEHKDIEFTHFFTDKGWVKNYIPPTRYKNIVCVGKCNDNEDMFAAYTTDGLFTIYKGHLNKKKI
jgi:hypothetical protein